MLTQEAARDQEWFNLRYVRSILEPKGEEIDRGFRWNACEPDDFDDLAHAAFVAAVVTRFPEVLLDAIRNGGGPEARFRHAEAARAELMKLLGMVGYHSQKLARYAAQLEPLVDRVIQAAEEGQAGDIIERREFAPAELMRDHPPVWGNHNKRAVFEIACPDGCRHSGRLVYTRWRTMELPDSFHARRAVARVEGRADTYDYVPVLGAIGAVEWHVNFADPELFAAYGSHFFAQDEMQVAEHPILGALREQLEALGVVSRTVIGGRPTPVLIRGAERRCRIATDPSPSEGRPRGLYGNVFAAAPVEAVRAATSRIEPPTITNLIAMAAPARGHGRYTARQIEHILTTAFTAFRAAVLESGSSPVAVHTGFWGCGAFGGNRRLMTLLQVLAADAAGVDRLVFHAVDARGKRELDVALRLTETALAEEPGSSSELVAAVEALGLEWGGSDGN